MSNNFFGSNSLSGKNINFSMTNARHINLANTNLRHIGIDNLNTTQDGLSAVNVKKIQTANLEPMMKYEPGHPEANKDGYVAYPNVNPVIEMVDLIEAMRSYEANVAVFQTQKTMDTKTLNILKG
jgi:flagellar basal-body rod protein FlgC